MNWPATVANTLWIGSSVPSWMAFRRALNRPREAQSALLRRLLARNSNCAYGRAHGFAEIRSYEEFACRVPLVEYENLAPWVERIRVGEPEVLTSERVTHLIPTSGSTGARKLIPFTNGLQGDFDRAISPWVADLARQEPKILGGPAYWCITPAQQAAETEPSAVPIGFADDASYLGGMKSWLVRSATVAPNELARVLDQEEFRYQTLLSLLRQRDLRLISIWHPSFLTLLLNALPGFWDKILGQLKCEKNRRSQELNQADPNQPETIWPHLRMISCWTDGHAEYALADLRRRFPNVYLQAKGLLATEAFVTIPFRSLRPVALRSHFFEFIDAHGRVSRAHQLREDEIYEVIVTTAGGLWRYRLHDQIQVTGFLGKTPSLQFVGRTGNLSDLFGEKLTEAFVAAAIQESLAEVGETSGFVLLAPDEDADGWRYTLYVEGAMPARLGGVLDRALRQNPQYAHCRELGQLQPARVFEIARDGYEMFSTRLVAEGKRLGDIKPVALSRATHWSKVFSASNSPFAGAPKL